MNYIQEFSQPTQATLQSSSGVNEKRWYAIHTRARHERKVTTLLQCKGVTTYLPLFRETHRWSDRHKTLQLALFPCYTFVRLAASSESRLDILVTPGVLGFVGIQGTATPIRDREIQDIQTLLAHEVTWGHHPFLHMGQRVRIRGGCMEGVEGILVAKNSDKSLVVSVELIQRSIAVRIDGFDVVPI